MRMEAPDKHIVRFIKKHHIFTLATAENNLPYCATCFYVYAEQNNTFIFTSEYDTTHIRHAVQHPSVAGTIALETKIIGKIRGIQFTGTIKELREEELIAGNKLYLKRFPYAKPFLKNTPFWSIDVNFIKLTDNRLGFANKLIWSKKKL